MSTVLEQQPTVVRGYRDYSSDRKTEVLALVAASGNVQQVARETGIPPQTIRQWLERADRYHSVSGERSLEQRLVETQDQLLDAIPGKIPDANLAQTATAFAIVFDKLQLLRGLPTSIVENLEATEITVVLSSALDDCIDITPEPVTDSVSTT